MNMGRREFSAGWPASKTGERSVCHQVLSSPRFVTTFSRQTRSTSESALEGLFTLWYAPSFE